MTNFDTEKFKRIEAIKRSLLEDWDPIGINGIDGANNEYDAYAKNINDLLQSRESEKAIIEYLWSIETESMGLKGDRQVTENFAAKLMQAFAAWDDN